MTPERAVTLLGSCFSDNIGARMRRALWDARVNPTGVLFNPASIATALRLCCEPEEVTGRVESSLVQTDGYWASLLFDSSCAAPTREECVGKCLEAIDSLRKSVAESQAVIVTLGTVWVYELASQPGFIAGNCHKLPQATFQRRRLSPDETEAYIREIVDCCHRLGCDEVIFTVSPVRHLRDDFHENTLSKATLHLAIDAVSGRSESVIEYFPAYEILLDDLRDYRWYASDLAHPSEEAVEYIWEKFQAVYLDAEGQATLREGESLSRALDHRPIVPFSASSEAYAARVRELRCAFILRHPSMLIP